MHHLSWRRFAAGVGGALLIAGCAPQVFYTRVVRSPRPLAPRPVDEVETFLVTPPSRPHTDIGILQIDEAYDYNTNQMIKELRARAARIGCDALLITSIDRRPTRYTNASIQASCVVYNDVSPPPADPPMPPPNPQRTAEERDPPGMTRAMR